MADGERNKCQQYIVCFRVSSGSIYGYSFVYAHVAAEEIDLVDPSEANAVQDPSFPEAPER